MSSFWNWGPHHHSGLSITTGFADTRYAHNDPHDSETGRPVSLHSPGQRRSYLARHPEIDPKSLPEVRDPNLRLAWDSCSTINGQPADLRRKYERIARESVLLKDRLHRYRGVNRLSHQLLAPPNERWA
jgi:hypothetical protein